MDEGYAPDTLFSTLLDVLSVQRGAAARTMAHLAVDFASAL